MAAGQEADNAGRDESGDPGEGRVGHLRRVDQIEAVGGSYSVNCDVLKTQRNRNQSHRKQVIDKHYLLFRID